MGTRWGTTIGDHLLQPLDNLRYQLLGLLNQAPVFGQGLLRVTISVSDSKCQPREVIRRVSSDQRLQDRALLILILPHTRLLHNRRWWAIEDRRERWCSRHQRHRG